MVELWTHATDAITQEVQRLLDPLEGLGAMSRSGATKGGVQPIRQLAGMRGLMADPSGRIIALPIRSNFREGLSALEYFLSTHGARKGLADTALRTADAGYLTRRLVDVAQDVIIMEDDCGTTAGIWFYVDDARAAGISFAERINGRVTLHDIFDPDTGTLLAPTGSILEDDIITEIVKAGVDRVFTRSPLTCEAGFGICRKCYGRDLARGGMVDLGEAVGIIAAQSIGEPGTQLTLRTFHTGGVAAGGDITQVCPMSKSCSRLATPRVRPSSARSTACSTSTGKVNDASWGQRHASNYPPGGDPPRRRCRASLRTSGRGWRPGAGETVVARNAEGEGEVIMAGADGEAYFEAGVLTVRREETED